MTLSAFNDDGTPPTPGDLKKVLGKAAPLWTAFIDGITGQAGTARQQWNFSGAKFGWSLRVLSGDRILTYVTPQDGAFLVGVVLGKKAIQPDRLAEVSAAAAKIIESAPQYAEGRGVRLSVSSRAALQTALEIATLKVKS